MYAMTAVTATDRTQLDRFRYHEKPYKHRVNATMTQPVEKSLDIPRRECAMRERGKFPKRYASVTRMNVASCETPARRHSGPMRAEHVSEDLNAPCKATRAATTFQIRFLLEWVLTPKMIAVQATAPNPIAR